MLPQWFRLPRAAAPNFKQSISTPDRSRTAGRTTTSGGTMQRGSPMTNRKASFNALANLSLQSFSFDAHCDELADALITGRPDSEDYWRASSRSLMAALIQCEDSKS